MVPRTSPPSPIPCVYCSACSCFSHGFTLSRVPRSRGWEDPRTPHKRARLDRSYPPRPQSHTQSPSLQHGSPWHTTERYLERRISDLKARESELAARERAILEPTRFPSYLRFVPDHEIPSDVQLKLTEEAKQWYALALSAAEGQGCGQINS